tara:strand:- start:241 stop:678 length:438 start_codon:yes stop_codon:yes gene_type:complete
MNELVLNKLEVGRVNAALEIMPVVPAAIGAAAHTVLISEIHSRILRMDPTADKAWTLCTAALAVAGTPGVKNTDTVDFSIINIGTAGVDEIITLAAGTGGTLVGSGAVLTSNAVDDAFSSGSGLFRLQFDEVTVGSEAISVYRLA